MTMLMAPWVVRQQTRDAGPVFPLNGRTSGRWRKYSAGISRRHSASRDSLFGPNSCDRFEGILDEFVV